MAEFKEFKPWLKFETRLIYGWCHLKLNAIFQAGAKLKPVFGGFETRLKFIKFGLCTVRPWRKILEELNLTLDLCLSWRSSFNLEIHNPEVFTSEQGTFLSARYPLAIPKSWCIFSISIAGNFEFYAKSARSPGFG